MKISAQTFEHICVLTLSGEYSADDADAFARAVDERVRDPVKHVVIDCEHLEFIDSAALESWLRLQERVGERGGQLRLIKPDPTVRTILRLTRLDVAFEDHDSLELAVRSLR